MIIHRSEYLDALLAKGLKAETLVRINLYLEQFIRWAESQAITDVREVTPKTVMDYHFYLTKYKKEK